MKSRPERYGTYGAALRMGVLLSGDPNGWGVPRSTARYWLKRGMKQDLLEDLGEGAEPTSRESERLRRKVIQLQRTLNTLGKIGRLPGVSQRWEQLGEDAQRSVVEILNKRETGVTLKAVLSTLGLGEGRFRHWKRQTASPCPLSPSGSCQRRWHSSLTAAELAVLRHLHTSPRFRHFSILSLSLYAKRENLLHCSASTWQKQAKQLGWERPHPYRSRWKKRAGLRVSRPNELWHVDTTHFKMTNGKTLYFQAVVDNHSRFIIAWKSTLDLRALNTVSLLRAARERTHSGTSPHVLMDKGPENRSTKVEKEAQRLRLKRTFAGVDVSFSNSVIEAVFRSLKSRYLEGRSYLGERQLRGEIQRFVREHNEVVPHAALRGGTPKEVFQGSWGQRQRNQLQERQQHAWRYRMASNLRGGCAPCPRRQPRLSPSHNTEVLPPFTAPRPKPQLTAGWAPP